MSTRPDFSGLYPDAGLTDQWIRDVHGRPRSLCITAARWGAQYAAEQLKHAWPEWITNRKPTEKDADSDGLVQFLSIRGLCQACTWETAAKDRDKWLHTPKWQPKPSSEAQQIADALRTGGATTAQHLRAAELLESLP